MNFYAFIKKSDLKSVMNYGLASSIAISKNPKILSNIFKDKKDEKIYVESINPNDITQKGVSVFFQKPLSISEILERDPSHLLGEDDYILLKIDYEALSKEERTRVFGLELEPYYSDEEYTLKKDKIEGDLTHSSLQTLSEMNSEEAWSNFEPMSGYYAPNVPHGVIITDSGYIKPKYIKVDESYMRKESISKIFFSFLKASKHHSEARYLEKMASSDIVENSNEINMEEMEINLDGFNPFSVKGEEKTIQAKGPKQYMSSSSLSINVKPVIMPDETPVYFVNDKYSIGINNTMFHDGATEDSGSHAFGSSMSDVYDNIKFDFSKEFFNKEIKDIQNNLIQYSKDSKRDDYASAMSELEDSIRSSDKIYMFNPSELSDDFEKDYKAYLSAPNVIYTRRETEATKILDSFKLKVRKDKSITGSMWYSKDTDTVYYSESVGLNDPVSVLYKASKEEEDSYSFVDEALKDPEKYYSKILSGKNQGSDSYVIPALYFSLGCNMFAFGNVLSEDGNLIIFEDKSLPEEGSVQYTGKGSDLNYKPMHSYIFKKDKAVSAKYREKLRKADGCTIKELKDAQYSDLKKREGDIPEYIQPGYDNNQDEPQPLSFDTYRNKINSDSSSEDWSLPDPNYPNINPGDSWKNICEIYPNHPKCKDKKDKFSYNPDDDFEAEAGSYKSGYGGQYMDEESIMESEIAQQYLSIIGGLSGIKNTTKIGDTKYYYIPSKKIIERRLRFEEL